MIEIKSLFGYASLQGPERYGAQKYGVPVGGAFDQISMQSANRLVGNCVTNTVLELALASCVLKSNAECLVAVMGANTPLRHGQTVAKCGTPIWLHPGDELSITSPSQGMLTYLAVRGGFAALGLVTTALKTGTELQILGSIEGEPRVGSNPPCAFTAFDVKLGPQSSMFNVASFFSGRYVVSKNLDRRGIRLEGTRLAGGAEITSEPCCPGAIQVTGDGQLIIIGPDGPTIGGYPKVAVLTRTSLSQLAQVRPGTRISFKMAR
jgi:allophanate hydrolase subunit 2